jgi:hypothetical protein
MKTLIATLLSTAVTLSMSVQANEQEDVKQAAEVLSQQSMVTVANNVNSLVANDIKFSVATFNTPVVTEQDKALLAKVEVEKTKSEVE